MTYDRFNDSLESPILVNAEVGRSELSFSIGIHPKEVLSIFPPEGVHLSWTFKQISTRGRVVNAKSITIHPRGPTL